MLKIPKAVYDQMLNHARECLPDEACGFLAGQPGQVSRYIPVPNTDASPTSYAMNPKTQIRIFRELDAEGLELVGIVHSHPVSAAEPSPKDRAMAFYPEVSYLILSLKTKERPELKSYKIVDDRQIAEETLIE